MKIEEIHNAYVSFLADISDYPFTAVIDEQYNLSISAGDILLLLVKPEDAPQSGVCLRMLVNKGHRELGETLRKLLLLELTIVKNGIILPVDDKDGIIQPVDEEKKDDR